MDGNIHLNCLGLGAPRTTRNQEGIAVLAELITNSIDISRLRLIALRVMAVQGALDGADFIDIFRFPWSQDNLKKSLCNLRNVCSEEER